MEVLLFLKSRKRTNLGLGPAFTISAALLPDFGQVETDPSQLNLSSFELFQPEKRSFFLQGMDAFQFDTSLNENARVGYSGFVTRDDSFANEAAFYSRRVGRKPRGEIPAGAAVVWAPAATSLLAAVKVSGQTQNGWRIGAFTAMTQQALAEIGDNTGAHHIPIEPSSQVSVLRIAKILHDGDSEFGTFFSNAHHSLAGELSDQFVRNAWSFGANGRFRFGKRRYEAGGWLLGTRLDGSNAAIQSIAQQPHHYFQRPDAPYLHKIAENGALSGLGAQAYVSRVGGNVHWRISTEALSPGYDVNEIGFQHNSDWLLATGTWHYERFTGKRWIRHWVVGSDNVGVGTNWRGELRAAVVGAFAKFDTTSFWSLSSHWSHDFPALSQDWLRGGPALLLPSRDTFRYSILSDQRKTSFLQFDGTAVREPSTGSSTLLGNPQVNVRVGVHLAFSVGVLYERDTRGWQYVAQQAGPNPLYIVARDRQHTLSPTWRTDFVLSRNLAIQIYAQPFASTGTYDRYKLLMNPRAANITDRFQDLSDSHVANDDTGTTSLQVTPASEVSFPTPDGVQRDMNSSISLALGVARRIVLHSRLEPRQHGDQYGPYGERSDSTSPRPR